MRTNRHPRTLLPRPAAPAPAAPPASRANWSITTLYRASTGTRTRETPFPYLRLSSHWLEQHGFARGSRVNVTVEKGGNSPSRSPTRHPSADAPHAQPNEGG